MCNTNSWRIPRPPRPSALRHIHVKTYQDVLNSKIQIKYNFDSSNELKLKNIICVPVLDALFTEVASGQGRPRLKLLKRTQTSEISDSDEIFFQFCQLKMQFFSIFLTQNSKFFIDCKEKIVSFANFHARM